MAVITWAAAKPLQFGSDIIFTYGPLGHLIYAIYIPRLFVPELVATIAIHILFLTLLKDIRLIPLLSVRPMLTSIAQLAHRSM